MATALDPKGAADAIRPGSERTFGLVFAAVFVLVGAWPLIGAAQPRWWAFAVAAAFAIAALAAPALLRPLNWAWHQFGLMLHRVVSPLVMGAIFFLCVTPVALIMRLLGENGVLLVTRIAGLLLSAIAVQLVADAVTDFIKAG